MIKLQDFFLRTSDIRLRKAKAMGFSTMWVDRRHGAAGLGPNPSVEAAPDATVPDLRFLAVLAGTMV